MARQSIRTPKNRDAFLGALVAKRSVTAACKAAKIGRNTAYEWRRTDPEFARMWAEASGVNDDDLEAGALSRAIDGWEEPVIYKGELCFDQKGKPLRIRKFSTGLTIFMLKARKPRMYHIEKHTAEFGGGARTGVLVVPGGQSPDEWIEANAEVIGENEPKKEK